MPFSAKTIFAKTMISFFMGLLMLAPLEAFAQNNNVEAPQWQPDYNKAYIEFAATMNDAPSKGAFKSFEAKIRFDPEHPEQSDILVQVDLRKLDTAYPIVATTLQKKDWFDTERWPTGIFKTVSAEQTGGNTYNIHGTLKLRATTHPVTVQATFEKTGENTAVIKGHTTVSRTKYNIGQGDWADTDVLADDIKVTFSAPLKKAAQ